MIYEIRPDMAYIMVNHSIQGESGLVPFGIPFIVSLPPSSLISIDDFKSTVLKLLRLARIVKNNGSNADDSFQAAMDGRPEEGQICTMDLIWDSQEAKDTFYDEEEDTRVRCFE